MIFSSLPCCIWFAKRLKSRTIHFQTRLFVKFWQMNEKWFNQYLKCRHLFPTHARILSILLFLCICTPVAEISVCPCPILQMLVLPPRIKPALLNFTQMLHCFTLILFCFIVFLAHYLLRSKYQQTSGFITQVIIRISAINLFINAFFNILLLEYVLF